MEFGVRNSAQTSQQCIIGNMYTIRITRNIQPHEIRNNVAAEARHEIRSVDYDYPLGFPQSRASFPNL